MSDTFRAFVAIDLPKSVRSALQAAQETLNSCGLRVRWVRPQGMHLTLKFLGNIKAGLTDDIVHAMALAAKGRAGLALTAKGIGVFPHVRRPRIIWAGLSGRLEVLKSMAETLDAHLASLGFPRETRAFKAHLTLGRVKGKIVADRLQAAIDKLETFESEGFEVSQIILFKSELRPSGAVYTKINEVPLG